MRREEYFDNLKHSGIGSERKNHKYVARVQYKTYKGRPVYRYFYTNEDYESYKRSMQQLKDWTTPEKKSPLDVVDEYQSAVFDMDSQKENARKLVSNSKATTNKERIDELSELVEQHKWLIEKK